MFLNNAQPGCDVEWMSGTSVNVSDPGTELY